MFHSGQITTGSIRIFLKASFFFRVRLYSKNPPKKKQIFRIGSVLFEQDAGDFAITRKTGPPQAAP
jgi:hypothetical protein